MRGVGKPKIEELTRKISALSKGQLAWLERVIKVYESPFQYKLTVLLKVQISSG